MSYACLPTGKLSGAAHPRIFNHRWAVGRSSPAHVCGRQRNPTTTVYKYRATILVCLNIGGAIFIHSFRHRVAALGCVCVCVCVCFICCFSRTCTFSSSSRCSTRYWLTVSCSREMMLSAEARSDILDRKRASCSTFSAFSNRVYVCFIWDGCRK